MLDTILKLEKIMSAAKEAQEDLKFYRISGFVDKFTFSSIYFDLII